MDMYLQLNVLILNVIYYYYEKAFKEKFKLKVKFFVRLLI